MELVIHFIQLRISIGNTIVNDPNYCSNCGSIQVRLPNKWPSNFANSQITMIVGFNPRDIALSRSIWCIVDTSGTDIVG